MIDTDQARNQLQQILSQKEYQVYYEDHRNFLEVWWDKTKHWVLEQLSKWFSSLDPSSSLAGLVFYVIVAGVLALAAIAIFLAFRSVRSKRKFRDHQPLKSLKEMQWSSRNHLSEARKQESAENYALAVRHLFLAVLLDFHDKEWLAAKSWKTNWEYFDELRKVDKQRAEQFYELALFFDEVFYGERGITRDEYTRYRDEVIKCLEPEQGSGQSTL